MQTRSVTHSVGNFVILTKRNIARILVLFLLLLLASRGNAQEQTDLAQGTVWDLRPLFQDAAAWDKEDEEVGAALTGLSALKGTLGSDASSLQSGLDRISAVRQRLKRLQAYARLKADEDATVEENQARLQRFTALQARFDAATSFVAPELLAMGRQRIESFEKADPELRRHQLALEVILRKQEHTLTPEVESVVASTRPLRQQPVVIHDIFMNADLPWPSVRNGSREIRLDPQAYNDVLLDPDRNLRRTAFEVFTSTLASYQRTLGALLGAYLSGATFEAKARHYPSSLALSIADEAMPEGPFNTLLAETDKALPALHRYIQTRKRLLGVDRVHLYDLSAPPVPDPHRYRLDEAESLILKALAPLGDEYVQSLASDFRAHSMHAIAHRGKAPGAYTVAAYGVQPYVLLTFTGTFASVSTVAHEWGHAMHFQMAQGAQPPETVRFSIFVADMPSLTNEMLLNDYQIAQARTRQDKILALSQAIDLLRTYYFGVKLYAELELRAYEASDRGEALTGQRFSEIYCGLLKRFYAGAGDAFQMDDSACASWANIRSVYWDFYVYRYMIATSAAAYFVEALEKNDAAVRVRFFALLKSGGSDDPYVLLTRAGFDPDSPSSYQPMVRRLERLVTQLEAAVAQRE